MSSDEEEPNIMLKSKKQKEGETTFLPVTPSNGGSPSSGHNKSNSPAHDENPVVLKQLHELRALVPQPFTCPSIPPTTTIVSSSSFPVSALTSPFSYRQAEMEGPPPTTCTKSKLTQAPSTLLPVTIPLASLSLAPSQANDNSNSADLSNHPIEKIKQIMELARKLSCYLLQFSTIKFVPAEVQSHLTCLSNLKDQLDQYKSIVGELCAYYSVVEGISNLESSCQAYYKAMNMTIDKVTQRLNDGLAEGDRLLVEYHDTQILNTHVAILGQLADYLNRVALLQRKHEQVSCATVNSNGDVSFRINLSKHKHELFSELYSSKKHHDVIFRIDDESIPAHRIILAAHSEYFDSLLYGDSLKEAEADNDIVLNDVSPANFQLLLKYSYTGRIFMDGAKLEDILELIEAADKFSVIGLKNALIDQLHSLVSVSTVLPLLLCADHLRMNSLQEVCIKFLDENASSVLQDESISSLSMEKLVKLLSRDTLIVDEMVVCSAVKLWIGKNSANITDCQPLIQCIRLSELSCESLVDLVEDNQLFAPAQLLDALKVRTNLVWNKMDPRGQRVSTNVFADKLGMICPTVYWKPKQPDSTSTGSTSGALPPRSPVPSALNFGTSNMSFKAKDGSPLAGFTLVGPGFFFTASDPIPANYSITDIVIRLYAIPTPVITIFNGLYLLNHLVFEVFNDCSSPSFHYSVEISKDETTFNTLIDYSEYRCHGRQELFFPTQAMRSMKIVFSPNNEGEVLHLMICQHSNDIPQCQFRENGVLGPLEWYSCAVQVARGVPSLLCVEEEVTVVKLTQPYYVSQLRFELVCAQPCGTVGDVSITYGLNGKLNLENTHKINTMILKKEPQDENVLIEISFSEQIINIFKVSLQNVINSSTSTDKHVPNKQFTIVNVMIKV